MMKAYLCSVIAAFAAVTFTDGSQYLTTKIVTMPTEGPLSIIDVILRQPHFQYSDINKGLTAIKDGKYKSCYIVDYDPYWTLEDSDKKFIMSSMKPVLYNFDSLRKKAGDVIAHMCIRLQQFWMTADLNDSPSLLDNGAAASGGEDFQKSPTLEPQPHQNEQEPMADSKLPTGPADEEAPPPVTEYSWTRRLPPKSEARMGSSDVQAPPPLAIWRQSHPIVDTLSAKPHSENNDIQVPPPLAEWRQSHPVGGPSRATENNQDVMVPPSLLDQPPLYDDSTESGGNDVQAPPPLDVWREQHPIVDGSDQPLVPHLSNFNNVGVPSEPKVPPIIEQSNIGDGLVPPPLRADQVTAPPFVVGYEVKGQTMPESND